MIVDKIENIGLYKRLHKGIDKALAYIKNTNFDALPVGKHEIDGDAVFAILKEYPTKPIEDQLMESHIKYIDVQYVIEGVEHMGVTMKSGKTLKKPMIQKMITCYLRSLMTLSRLKQECMPSSFQTISTCPK